jgi:TPR repeat protein
MPKEAAFAYIIGETCGLIHRSENLAIADRRRCEVLDFEAHGSSRAAKAHQDEGGLEADYNRLRFRCKQTIKTLNMTSPRQRMFSNAETKTLRYDSSFLYAQVGDSNGQCSMALLCAAGWGVPRDFELARQGLLKATQHDNPVAWNNLGSLYITMGEKEKAHRCYERAKELGFNVAHPYPRPR